MLVYQRVCLIFLRTLTLVSCLFHTLDVCKHHGPTLAAHRAPSCRLLPSNRLPEGTAATSCYGSQQETGEVYNEI